MKGYLIWFLLLFSIPGLYAQETDSSAEEADEYWDEESDDDEDASEVSTYPPLDPREVWKKNGYDSERVEIKRFDEKKWKEIVGNTNYQEKEEEEEEKKDRPSLSFNLPIPPIVLKIIFYAFVLSVIGYLLFVLLKNTSLKKKLKVENAPVDPAEQVADIKELEVDRLLQEALAAGNYPLAIRICFLGLLKKLDEDGLIIWKKDKTNRDYLMELFHKQHHFDEVRRLTLVYEEVWYGDHNFSLNTYQQIITSFKSIDEKLKTSKASEAK